MTGQGWRIQGFFLIFQLCPDFSTKIRERFLEPAKAENKKTAPTIKNYLIALTKFVSFGIDIQHFESRQNAQDFKIRVDRWKCSPRKKIAEHITRKKSEAGKLTNTLILINYVNVIWLLLYLVFCFIIPIK